MAEFRAAKYCGGVYCGNGEFDSIQECIDFANDGFCDYVRIASEEISLKVKITASKKWDEIG